MHETARRVIDDGGYGEFFNHGTGHGVGIDMHEEPRFRNGFGGTLEPGNVVTVEPGVYLPGRFGVRIEDLVARHRGRSRGAHAVPQIPPVGVAAMAETINTNQFKNGMCIDLDGVVWKIVEFQHVKPGKGGAFVRTKLKQMEGGKVVDKTFRAGESMPRVHTTVQDMQFLFDDGANVVLMNTDTYEQIGLPRDGVADELQYLKEGDVVQLLSLDGRPGLAAAARRGRAASCSRPSPASRATRSRT